MYVYIYIYMHFMYITNTRTHPAHRIAAHAKSNNRQLNRTRDMQPLPNYEIPLQKRTTDTQTMPTHTT